MPIVPYRIRTHVTCILWLAVIFGGLLKYSDQSCCVFRIDKGVLVNKKDLPVRQVNFGDTGDNAEDKIDYKVGKLVCHGKEMYL